MIAVADTHAALWHLFGDARLSGPARRIFETAGAIREKIGVSSISLVEVVYLVEKGRLHSTAFEELKEALDDPIHILEEVSLSGEVVRALRQVPREAVPDMPDRIVAATAVFLNLPLISRDGQIRASSVETIW